MFDGWRIKRPWPLPRLEIFLLFRTRAREIPVHSSIILIYPTMANIKGMHDPGMGSFEGNGTATVLHGEPYLEENKSSPNFSVEMEDSSGLDHLTLRLDENDEINAITLTNLLNSGVEEALSNLSPLS